MGDYKIQSRSDNDKFFEGFYCKLRAIRFYGNIIEGLFAISKIVNV